MVVIEAESPDPKLAADAARAVLSVLQELVRQRQAERFAAAEQRLEGQIGELTAVGGSLGLLVGIAYAAADGFILLVSLDLTAQLKGEGVGILGGGGQPG